MQYDLQRILSLVPLQSRRSADVLSALCMPPPSNPRSEQSRTAPAIPDICPSCGHCLQVMWEQCDGNRAMRLMQLMANGEAAVTTIGDAYPMAFGPKDLGIDVFAR